jgi:hypothetical protein
MPQPPRGFAVCVITRRGNELFDNSRYVET